MSNNYPPLFPDHEKNHRDLKKDDLKKNCRRDNPPSSHRAVSDHAETGRLDSNRHRALTQVRARPGLTSKQYAGDDFRWLNELRKRLPELERDGLVRSVQIGTDDKRWYPAG